jgi:hypothetical protein
MITNTQAKLLPRDLRLTPLYARRPCGAYADGMEGPWTPRHTDNACN